jgi:uncharacterized protein YbaP (TraB family)
VRRHAARLLAAVLPIALVATACQTTTTSSKSRTAGRPGKVKVSKQKGPQAFFWEAKGPNGERLFLLGSVHIGDGRELALDPRIEEDWQRSQDLVVQLDTTSLSEFDALGATHRHGLLPEPTVLSQVVRADTYAQLVQYIRQRGYDMDRVDQMRPWFVAQVVTGLEYDAAGWNAQNGVDAVLLRRSQGQKPIVPLETLEEQMALFASMPDAVQETWLREILREEPALLLVTRAILDAWERGDDAALARLLFGNAETDPALAQFYASVFQTRNPVLTDRLLALAADGRPRFAVIHTGHLLGEQGIPALLAQRGFEVERVGSARVVAPQAAQPGASESPAPEATAPEAPAPAVPAPSDAAPPAPSETPPAPTAAPAEPAPIPTAPAEPGPTPVGPSPDAPAAAPATKPAATPGAPVTDPAAPAVEPAPQPAAQPAVAPAPLPKSKDVHDDWLRQDAPAAP